ncbi:hypothetical protein KSD_79410 [Ktedonobacter sp. SOSP1-85]|nr:hypothetical protein KSD_79410 [Ktedonobacter sp. SOSP1-85]
MNIQRLTMSIENLSYGGGGTLQVERALARLSGVIYTYVNPVIEMAYVKYDPEQVNHKQLVKAVKQAGFEAGSLSLHLRGERFS